MNQIAPKKEFTVNDLVLCDVLHAYGEGSNHVAIITGILRDETGEIVKVEVSEAVRTTCRRRLFTVGDFYGRFGERYKLCRYEYLDSIPPFNEEENKILFESGIEKRTPTIAIDYGDKTNYFEGILAKKNEPTDYHLLAHWRTGWDSNPRAGVTDKLISRDIESCRLEQIRGS